MKLTVREDAQAEGARHIAWYRERDPRAGQRLAELLADTMRRIAADPHRFSRLEYRRNKGNIRRALLKKFPIMVVYEVVGNEVDVFAIAHTAQRPGYWRARLKK
jgi:toxin ParE1/3/4